MGINPFVAANVVVTSGSITTTPVHSPSAVERLLTTANDDNATIVKAAAGYLFHIDGYKATAAVCYLKLYDLATEPDETDTPLITLVLPASARFEFNFLAPIPFDDGISFRIVDDAADNGTTAVEVGDVLALNIVYA